MADLHFVSSCVIRKMLNISFSIDLMTGVNSGKSANFYYLSLCGCYVVVDEIAFFLPRKD